MGSSFPGGYDNFTSKTDNVDTNYAADINRLQDTASAIEQTIGVGVLSFQNVTYSAVDYSGSLSFDPEATSQTNSSVSSATTTNFASIADYLMFLRQGQNFNFVTYQANSQWIQPSSPDFSSTIPDLVNLVNSGTAGDPDGLWNGVGFTVPFSGFWLLEGYVQYATTSDVNANATYEAAISIGSNDWTTGLDRREVTQGSNFGAGKYYPAVTLNVHRLQYVAAGSVIALRSSHTSPVAQRISGGFLSGTLLRQQ